MGYIAMIRKKYALVAKNVLISVRIDVLLTMKIVYMSA